VKLDPEPLQLLQGAGERRARPVVGWTFHWDGPQPRLAEVGVNCGRQTAFLLLLQTP